MFGTEMVVTTFVLTIIELVVLFFQFINYLSRVQDKSRLRFLILTALFVVYNCCSGFFPDKNIAIDLLIQNILAYGSGILLASYYFYYLVKELNINQGKLFNLKILSISLSLSFVIGFVFTYWITGSFQLSKSTFITFPVIIAVYFCIKTVGFILKYRRQKELNKEPYNSQVFSGYLGIVFMATMPIVVFFGDFQTINIGLVNVSFMLALYAYFKMHLFQSRAEYEVLNKIGYFQESEIDKQVVLSVGELKQYSLTSREMEIALLILKRYTYSKIAEETFITPKTVSKHASNIFKKTDCSNRNEFIDKFSGAQEKNKDQVVYSRRNKKRGKELIGSGLA